MNSAWILNYWPGILLCTSISVSAYWLISDLLRDYYEYRLKRTRIESEYEEVTPEDLE
jgi:hypothetical protein